MSERFHGLFSVLADDALIEDVIYYELERALRESAYALRDAEYGG